MLERRTLWLVRHADASPPKASQDDFDRPLSPRGEQELASISRQLIAVDAHADWMLVSSARRTQQTAAAVAPALGLAKETVQLLPELFHATVEGLLSAITSVPPDVQVLAVVSHNPGLSDLATRCNQGRTIRLPTLGCSCFITRSAVADWSSLGCESFEHRYTLQPDTGG